MTNSNWARSELASTCEFRGPVAYAERAVDEIARRPSLQRQRAEAAGLELLDGTTVLGVTVSLCHLPW